jgi:hypothetical protein
MRRNLPRLSTRILSVKRRSAITSPIGLDSALHLLMTTVSRVQIMRHLNRSCSRIYIKEIAISPPPELIGSAQVAVRIPVPPPRSGPPTRMLLKIQETPIGTAEHPRLVRSMQLVVRQSKLKAKALRV